MKYNFLFLLITVSILVSCNTNQQKTGKTDINKILQNEIKFEWQSLELDGVKYKHGAMYLPVYIDSINKEFKMQFDLGLNVSAIYENPLNTIISKHPYLKDKVKIGKDYEVIMVKTKIDNYKSSVDSLFVFKEYGERTDYNKLSKIGSIGANELEDKILLIDFKNTTLTILNDSTELVKIDYDFVPLEYKQGKIFIPLSINGKTHNYIYDTGASIFPIATIDKDFFTTVNKKAIKLDTVKLNSWGKQATFIKSKIEVPIQMEKMDLSVKNKSIFYTEEQKIIETFNYIGVKGLVGNDFFIDNVIVIDLINNKFGIRKQ